LGGGFRQREAVMMGLTIDIIEKAVSRLAVASFSRPHVPNPPPQPTHSATGPAYKHLDMWTALSVVSEKECRAVVSSWCRTNLACFNLNVVCPPLDLDDAKLNSLFFLRCAHAHPPTHTRHIPQHHDHDKMELAIGQQPSNGLAYTNRYVR